MASKVKQEFLEVFLEESLPLAEQVSAAALQCEALWSKDTKDLTPLRGMRSALHTVKGNAGMVGFTEIATFAHTIEEAIHGIEETGRHDAVSARLLVEAADLLVVMVGRPLDTEPHARATALQTRLARVKELPVTQPVSSPSRPARAAAASTPARSATASLRPPGKQRVAPDEGEGQDGGQGEKPRNVRVNFRVLDGLLDGLGEAISCAAAVGGLKERCSALDGALGEELDLRVARLERELRGLRQLVTRARLVAVGTTFARFAHLVRTLSRSRGIEVRWVERGAETMVDKAILDRLGEPLLHVLRNAIAHGIEPPDARRALGKPSAGTITIEVRLDRDRLRIAITDDGRGIDVEAVRDSAAKRGAAVSGMTRAQLLRLVFLPGLTTNATPDSLSGRGVGLDAVESVVRELDGSIQVDSELGRGTRFELILPTTAALLSGLVFRVDGEQYTIATQHVVEAVPVRRDAVQEVNGRKVFAWRELVPAIDARDLLQTGRLSDAQPGRCIVLEVGGERCGLLVSEVTSRIEGLVKSLDGMVCYSPTIVGTTISPDGTIIPIVDARRAMTRARSGAQEPDGP